MQLLPKVPAKFFKPFRIEASQGLLIISNTHCGDSSRNPGYGDYLASHLDSLSTQVVVVLNGDVGRDSDCLELYPYDITSWSTPTIRFWLSVGGFIGRGGTVYLIPATHNRPLERWYAEQLAGGQFCLADYPAWRAELPPNLGEEHQTFLSWLGQIRLAPSLVVTVGNKTLLVDHGNTFDDILPWYHAYLQLTRRWRGIPREGSRFGKPLNGAFILNLFRGIERQYAKRAQEYGCTTVLLGHWHCPGRQHTLDGVTVIVASLCTDGACVVGQVLPNGKVLLHDLLAGPTH
ncbi:MAG: hypothetical protein INF43_03755 [Alphaproteobacteria bacterium]|nr:hypothetical protein [Alphaproteobacteria bacterium]